MQQDQHTDLVYPILLELLEEGTAPPALMQMQPDAAQTNPPPPATLGTGDTGDTPPNGRQPTT